MDQEREIIMGMYEFGEYLFGTIIMINIMLMAFGGLPDAGFILGSNNPANGIGNPGSIGFNELDQNGTFSGTPYASPTVTPENSNLLENLLFDKIPKIFGYIAMGLFGFAIAIHWIGLPTIVEWTFIAPLGIFMLFYSGFFIARLIGSLRGGGSV